VVADLDNLDLVTQKRSEALFLLKMKEAKRLPQTAIDAIVEEWESLFSHSIQQLLARVRSKMAAAGISITDIDGLQIVFDKIPQPFDGLQTRYMQEKYFRESLGLVIRFLYKMYMPITQKHKHTHPPSTFYIVLISFPFTIHRSLLRLKLAMNTIRLFKLVPNGTSFRFKILISMSHS